LRLNSLQVTSQRVPSKATAGLRISLVPVATTIGCGSIGTPSALTR
jgi:hypothetical protein